MTRYCPKCGEPVPSFSLTCPKCYAKIPQEPAARPQEDSQKTEKKGSQASLLLSVIPGFFGLLGLGHIYRDYKDGKGYFFLIVGLILFICGNTLLLSLVPDLLVGVVKTIVGVGLLLLYGLLFLISVLDSVIGIHVAVRKS